VKSEYVQIDTGIKIEFVYFRDIITGKIKRHIKGKKCKYCKQYFKVLDGRHYSRCKEYIKQIPFKKGGKEIRLIDGLEHISPVEKIEFLDLGNGTILPIFNMKGEWYALRIQFRDILEMKKNAMNQLYKTLKEEELLPNWFSLTSPKRITRRVLLRDFEGVISDHPFPTMSSFVLLRVPDMIILASRAETITSNRILLVLAHKWWGNAKWITELIFKLNTTDTFPEKMFMIGCLSIGIILEKIEPQRHYGGYRIMGTTHAVRPDFKIWDKFIVEINEEYDLSQHQQGRDNPRQRFFLEKGKMYIPYTNREIRHNLEGCLINFRNILIKHGVDFWKDDEKNERI